MPDSAQRTAKGDYYTKTWRRGSEEVKKNTLYKPTQVGKILGPGRRAPFAGGKQEGGGAHNSSGEQGENYRWIQRERKMESVNDQTGRGSQCR